MPEREFLCQSNGTTSPSDINEANKSTSLSAQLHWWRGGVWFLLLFPPLYLGENIPYYEGPTVGTLSRAICQRHPTALAAEQENGDLNKMLLDPSSILQSEGTLLTRCQKSVVRRGTTETSCRWGWPPLLKPAVPVASDGSNHILQRDVERGWSWGEHRSVTLAEYKGVNLSQPRCKTDTAAMLPAHSISASPVKLEMF